MGTATQRLAAQLLTERPARSAVAVVEHLLAVQAQDVRGFPLAVRARSRGLGVQDVKDALAGRELVVTWLNRGTLHLVRTVDLPWLQALTTPQLVVGNARRLRQEGVSESDAERGVELVVDALRTDGPLLRADLRRRLTAAGVPVGGQALVHVLMLASLRGLVLRGPYVGSEQAFVATTDWVPATPAIDPEAALVELARRYLVGHAPASAQDLAAWAGIALGAARRGLAGLADDVVRNTDGQVRPADGGADAPQLPAPVLLGTYDPVLHGWPERQWVLGRHSSLVTVNGLFRPVVLVDGRAVGTWSRPRGRVELELAERVPASVRAALDEDAADVERYLAGGPVSGQAGGPASGPPGD